LGNIYINKGRIVKELKKIISKDTTIIKPKSIIGLILEKIKDPKATIVVKAVYRHGQNICVNVYLKLLKSSVFL
tara:strand:+ start:105 stop:326 length:222 start_codon:yes stop_codon:yes gene_type:complete